MSVVLQLSDRLRHSEGQFSEAGLSGAGQEPDWLTQLRFRHHALQVRTNRKGISFEYVKLERWNNSNSGDRVIVNPYWTTPTNMWCFFA